MTRLPAHIARCKGQRVSLYTVTTSGAPWRATELADQCQACRRGTVPALYD
jgi:hypothetical protein